MNEGILIVIKLIFKSIEVEAISDVFLVHFTEKLMIFQIAEPTYPPITLFGTIGFGLRHGHCGLLLISYHHQGS